MLNQIFKAYDIRGTYPDKVNPDAAWKIGVATGRFLQKHALRPDGEKGRTVVVSRDMRTSSPSLSAALVQGLRASGMDVIDLGMADTSMIYFAVNHLGCAGGIQTTASHNPPQYNGFKISGPLAKPIGGTTGLKEIQAEAETLGNQGSLPLVGGYRELDIWDAYRHHVRQFLLPLRRPVRAFVDASNGMAGHMVPRLFNDIENLEIIELNFEITGSFVHDPNPLVAENMIPTLEGVRNHRADLGACFDGDADRCILADDLGHTIGCDHLTALLAGHFIALDQQAGRTEKSAILYDLRSSKVVEETILALDATPLKSRVGHVFMKQALRDHQGVFGGELSGHFYFRDNFYADSGAIAFAAVLSIIGQTEQSLSELIAPFRKYPQSGEINFHTEDKDGVLATLKSRYADATIEEIDGVTIDAFNSRGWWFNVRASNTEPLLRLNAEARDEAQLMALLNEITPTLGTPAEGH